MFERRASPSSVRRRRIVAVACITICRSELCSIDFFFKSLFVFFFFKSDECSLDFYKLNQLTNKGGGGGGEGRDGED